MLPIKEQMNNAKCPVKCHTQSTKSTAFCKYAYHLTGHHALKDKSILYGIHQMVILNLLFSGHHTLMDDKCIMPIKWPGTLKETYAIRFS